MMEKITAQFIEFESKVMQMLLAGDEEAPAILREQLKLSAIGNRVLVPAGFYTEFTVPRKAPRLGQAKVVFGDVEAFVSGLDCRMKFLLFVENGRLTMLTGSSVGTESWLEHIGEFELRYTSERQAESTS
jgi:hypothetical protein